MKIDWTVGSDGRSNTSDRFVRLCKEVEEVIRNSAHDLLSGYADRVAGTIVARLAHVHGLVPSPLTEWICITQTSGALFSGGPTCARKFENGHVYFGRWDGESHVIRMEAFGHVLEVPRECFEPKHAIGHVTLSLSKDEMRLVIDAVERSFRVSMREGEVEKERSLRDLVVKLRGWFR